MGSTFMDSFCGSSFWDWELTWETPNPYFTPCFEKTALVWFPCAFLWLFVPMDIYYANEKKSSSIPWNILNITKALICVLLTTLQLILLYPAVFPSDSSGTIFPVELFTPAIQAVTFLLALAILLYTKLKGVRSSGVQFVFWFLLFCCETIRFRSVLSPSQKHDKNEIIPYVVRITAFAFTAAQFVLSCWADASPVHKQSSASVSGIPCPEEGSSYISRLLFHWYNGLAIRGFRKPLEYKDLWVLNDEDTSKTLVPIFNKHWENSLAKAGKTSGRTSAHAADASYNKINGINIKTSNSREPVEKAVVSVLPALLSTFGRTFFFGAGLKIIPDLMAFVSPQILDALIAFVTPGEPGAADPKKVFIWHGYLYAALLFISAFLQTLFMAQYSHRMYMTAMRVRTVLVSAIYRKALVISNSAKRNSTLGEIVNYMSVDVQKIMDNIPFMNMLWSAPLQIAIAMYFLWGILGPSTLAGLAVIILLVPANAIIAGKARKYQMEQMKYKDQRIKLINEILSGVKVLKLYAWEPSFENQILEIRGKEIEVLRKAAYLNAGTNFLWTCAPFMVSLSTYATYVLSDDQNVLDAQKVFVSMSLFNIINMSVTFLPMIIIFVVQAGVSLKRINKFMNSEEIDPNAVSHDESETDPIVIENGTFAWEDSATLQDINLRIKTGSLVAVVGTVGSGKTSLLSAILGELEKHSGRVNTKGTIGYVAQQAWIQNSTLRENITFGNKFDPIKYDKVIDACALKPDLQILPAGDQTEIGEKGINLSGGQKQRVALARATYTFTDVYLFDDPLSAVDSHVGKHIFEKVIGPKGYLKRKTRVLVTHGIAFLPQVDQILVMKDGRISESGTYQELIDKKGAFAEFLAQHVTAEDISEIEDSSMIEALKEVVGPLDKIPFKRMESRQSERGESDFEGAVSESGNTSAGARMRSMSLASSHSGSFSGRKGSKTSPVKNRLIEVEKSETEGVKMKVYVDYFRAAGWVLTFAMFFLYLVFQGFALGSSLWLSKWSDEPSNENGTQEASTRDMYLGVYGALGFFQSVSILAATILMAIGTLKSASVLHQRMLSRILKAPMSFFDTTPLGRIVNRFAKDIDTCDNTIPFMLRLWLNSFLQVASTVVIISYTTPIFIAVIIPIGILYYFVQRIYVSSSRQLKRIESVSRSPIYSHFGETVSGAVTIRGFGQQERFIRDSENKVDHNQVSYFPAVTANRWLAVRLESVGNTVILFAAIFAVIGMDTLEPGLVGLSISYALQITIALNMLVRWTSDLETNIVSVERVKEYTETPIEAPWEIPERKPPKTWPETGEVIFDRYQSRYREGLDLVLRNVSCTIKGGEKVGICGRTGAGKSSMTLGLFRIVEAAGGSIVIDGQNISKLGLHDVRGRITIIPQDPVLFSGTLRINLDPFETHTDAQLWRVLELAHLKSFASSLQAGLNHAISEGGDNLSVGQRQLVCLARALLRRTKVIVLDEATAAVDLETDDLIQATIRKEFADATVITIAHRLNTIMDSNRVIVLDKGEIREFDTPENLMSNKHSIFYGMAKDAGISS